MNSACALPEGNQALARRHAPEREAAKSAFPEPEVRHDFIKVYSRNVGCTRRFRREAGRFALARAEAQGVIPFSGLRSCWSCLIELLPAPTDEDQGMKHLLTGVAVIAVLAISAPVWAQPANPSGGNSLGVPGPNPGGPGLTPYSTGAPPPPSGRMPAGGRQTSEPTNIPSTPSASDTTAATPPMHRPARKGSHGRMAGHPQLTGSTAGQLNQEELARLQAGDTSMPAAPPAPGVSGNPQLNRMPAGGRATSGTAR